MSALPILGVQHEGGVSEIKYLDFTIPPSCKPPRVGLGGVGEELKIFKDYSFYGMSWELDYIAGVVKGDGTLYYNNFLFYIRLIYYNTSPTRPPSPPIKGERELGLDTGQAGLFYTH